MAKTFTNDEKREIEEKAKYILAAMDDIGKNGDAYCTDEQLFRASKTVRPSLTGQRYRTDKALLLQAGFLHQEGYHLYAKRTWDYEVTAAERLAGILNRVRRNCRVVLLGDTNQLQSVGAGNVLPDLLELGVPSIRLAQQYRQSTDAAALRQNVVDFPKLNGEHELRWDDSFRLLPADDRAIPDLLCEEAARRYRAGESIQVLSPVRVKTGFSVQALNTRLQNEVNPLTAEKPTWGKFRDGDRVIVTQNNAYYNICNGDVGVLHIRGEKPHRVAVLAVRGTLKTWQIDRGQGEYGIGHDDAPPPQLALAYALTVHKSQGSQYDTVLMPVSMATARMLYRNLLYTAISRAGKEVILVGSREALNTAMQCIPYPRKSKLVARTNLLRLGRSA